MESLDGLRRMLTALVKQSALYALSQLILEKRPDLVDVRTQAGKTPLLRAVGCGAVDLVQLLVRSGADMDGVCKTNPRPPPKFEPLGDRLGSVC